MRVRKRWNIAAKRDRYGKMQRQNAIRPKTDFADLRNRVQKIGNVLCAIKGLHRLQTTTDRG